MYSVDRPSFAEWDTILFPGWKEALLPVMRRNLNGLTAGRFGFVPARTQLSGKDRLLLEVISGHAVYFRSARPDFVSARVIMPRLAVSPMVGLPTAPAGSREEQAWQRKRDLIWHNERRNSAIAAIAKAFAAGDIATLWTNGILLDEHWFEQRSGLTVMLIVETGQHGHNLAALLPGWTVETNTWIVDSPGHLRYRMPPVNRAIVTAAWIEARGLAADFMIRADGTASRWNAKAGQLRDQGGEPMLIIDFADDFDRQAEADAQQRLQDYLGRGWQVTGPLAGTHHADPRVPTITTTP